MSKIDMNELKKQDRIKDVLANWTYRQLARSKTKKRLRGCIEMVY